MKVIALIPARRGSKGIINKNSKKIIKGKSLADFTFAASSNSRMLAEIFLSSNDPKVLKIAKKYKKINLSYKRPLKVSKDGTSMYETVYHFYLWLLKQKKNFDYLMILQPTSPLRTSKDIDKAIKILKTEKKDSLFSVSEIFNHPYELVYQKGKKVKFFINSAKTYFQRQQFKIDPFFIDGSIYMVNERTLKRGFLYNLNNHSLFFVEKERSLDINNNSDIKILKKILL